MSYASTFPFCFWLTVLKCATRASPRKLLSERINREVRQAGQVNKVRHKERALPENVNLILESRALIADMIVSHRVSYVRMSCVRLPEHNICVLSVFERIIQWSSSKASTARRRARNANKPARATQLPTRINSSLAIMTVGRVAHYSSDQI